MDNPRDRLHCFGNIGDLMLLPHSKSLPGSFEAAKDRGSVGFSRITLQPLLCGSFYRVLRAVHPLLLHHRVCHAPRSCSDAGFLHAAYPLRWQYPRPMASRDDSRSIWSAQCAYNLYSDLRRLGLLLDCHATDERWPNNLVSSLWRFQRVFR